MTGAWPMMPRIPAAGHVTAGGAWHPNQIDGCQKCAPPARRAINRNAVRAGDSITYTSVVVGDPDLTARVEYTTRDACHVITARRLRYAIVWRRVTGHEPSRGGGRG